MHDIQQIEWARTTRETEKVMSNKYATRADLQMDERVELEGAWAAK